VSASKILN